jgi:methionyl-tRNA formyltransferase
MSLRIVLVGQAAFGEKTLERLLPRHDVVAVYCPPDTPGGKPDPLKALATAHQIPVLQPKSMKTDEVHESFQKYRADLGLLAFVTVIVPERIIRLPKLGTLCFHPSLLPRHRGGSAINWQIIHGETRGGLTIFWTDAGIDTGPILLQKEVAIGPDDTVGSLYYEKIVPLGLDAIEESVNLVDEGRAPRISQDERLATYDPLCRDPHVGIDWSRPGREIYDLVRGSDPQPGAWALRGGDGIRLYDCRFDESRRGERGRVLALEDRGAVIGLGESALVVSRMRLGNSPKKVAPADLARDGKLEVGEQLDSGR